MPKKKSKGETLSGLRHPEFTAFESRWEKWWLCYEGADAFREEFLQKYSKREETSDFNRRKKLTYIPGHARSSINIIRNALAVQLPDVVRKGSQSYLDAMARDVDTFQSSMSSFVALKIVPGLLVQGKIYTVVDAPGVADGTTRAEDDGRPYIFTVAADDMLSWSYDSDGRVNAALMRLYEDVVDTETGLVVGTQLIFRYYKLMAAGESFAGDGETVTAGATGGVLVWEVDKDGKETAPTVILDLTRVPITEFRAVASLMSEIADHQISMLNLASTDMDFLWRNNFPIYVEMTPKGAGAIRPRGTRKTSGSRSTQTSVDGTGEAGAGKSDRQRNVGTGKGVGYPEGTDKPGFIAPDVENLKASMAKQDSLATEIRVLTNLSLTSMSVKALEQSGASKEADRIGEEAGLAYIGRILETGERDIAILWAMMEAESGETDVNYPQTYTLKSDEERQEEAKKLHELRPAVNSEAYKKAIDRAIADKVLRQQTTPEEMTVIIQEIDDAPFVNDDIKQAESIRKDAVVGLVSAETSSKLLGYEDGEVEKANVERSARVAERVGASGEGTQ